MKTRRARLPIGKPAAGEAFVVIGMRLHSGSEVELFGETMPAQNARAAFRVLQADPATAEKILALLDSEAKARRNSTDNATANWPCGSMGEEVGA